MTKTERNKLLKVQWEQLTHEEKRALAVEQLAVDLEAGKAVARQQARNATVAARKWQEDAPKREAFAAYLSSKRRLTRG